jgi:gamma-glutamyltranspeptidase/glutathione hydrolase
MAHHLSSKNILSNRPAVIGKNGMVATSQPLAVAAGLNMLAKGGNAADAAVATAAALNVTEPTSTGIGGDCFALYYQAASKQISALNGSGRAPRALSLEVLKEESITSELPPFHPHTVTVPGAAAGWSDLVKKHGKLHLKYILSPAIKLAEEGFPVAPITSFFWDRGVTNQLKNAPNGIELTLNGRAPSAGEIFTNPGLAHTFRILADGGSEAFYQGEIGKAIVDVLGSNGGLMSLEDLAAHTSTWETPISTTFNGYRIWECPPNGQGLAALLGLNIIEEFDLNQFPPLSTERLHLMIESMRLAFADTRWFVTDPKTNPTPVNELLSKSYASERSKLINPLQATIDHVHGSPTSHSDTAYLSVVDRDGNACSFINSNFWGFGTGIVPKGYGFTLQNRGLGFSLDPDHPNVLSPGKRPYHTIIPSMITHVDTDELFASFGVMGGFMQPQGHLQIAINLIHDKMDPIDTMAELSSMGHNIEPTSGYHRAIFGRGQIIIRDRELKTLWGGSDQRADGLAMSMV